MIQLNLLPDVKLEYIKAQKLRSLVTGISIIVSLVAIAILSIMLIIDFAEKARISALKSDINTATTQLQNKPNIKKILTVQNQLKSLTALYAQRPAAAQLFTTYLNELTPEAVSLNQFSANFTQNAMTISGSTNSLTTVNQYVDTLKLTTYSVSGSNTKTPAFSNVVLSTFGYNTKAENPNQLASFTISIDFDPALFDVTKTVTLNIPNTALTHTQAADTNSLFEPVVNKGGQ